MKRYKTITWLALSAALCFGAVAQEPAAPAATQPQMSNTAGAPAIEIGGIVGAQAVDVDNDRGLARFEEFRDVPEGVVLDFARFAWRGGDIDHSFTAIDAGQNDQRYFLELWKPQTFRFGASYVESQRTYSTGSKTLFSGIGTNNLTIDEGFRQGAENAAGAPNAPFANPALIAYMENALATATEFDLRSHRKDLKGALEFNFARNLTLSITGRNEQRDGTRPLGFGTYIRRQALANTPGTGAGNFWRETVESRGVELIEPLDYDTTEFGATLTWAGFGHTASAGVFASRFRNDNAALYFDNPFEATPGRASATTFDPGAEQEPGAPNGNNNLRGLFARTSMSLAPNNDYERIFANASFKLPFNSRLNATVAFGEMTQDDAFLPYAENPFVVYSGVHGQPGVVYAKDAPLPAPSLDGTMETTQVDLRLTSRITPALQLRGGIRYYDLDDQRPQLIFPGYSSSGDAYFRAGIGQRDANGKRILFNNIGGYTRERGNIGAAYRIGRITLDGEVLRTIMDYDERQVDETTEDTYRATVRFAVAAANVNAFYARSNRDFDGEYHVGLETSGVRAYDVWTRERDQFGFDVELPIGENISAGFGGSMWKDEYPGAIEGRQYGWGLQDAQNASVFAQAAWSRNDVTISGTVGYDRYEINSLQVTKTSLTTDYNPINRWTRESNDRVVWFALEGIVPVTEKIRVEAALDFQRFNGEWNTTNLATPDVNSAVAYDYPELSDRTISARGSLLWDFTEHLAFELRYLYEPYRLDDFTVDIMQPYMQGRFKETRSNPNDIGDNNVSRFLFLDSRYTDYDAHVASAMLHLTF